MKRENIDLKSVLAAVFLTVLTAVLVVFLAGRTSYGGDGDASRKQKDVYGYFDTICSIYGYAADTEGEFEENCRLIEEKLDHYHKLFDIYNEYDGIVNVATLNRLAGQGEVKASADLINFLNYAISMHELTDGNVNIAMGSVLSIWHDYRTAGVDKPWAAKLPPMEKLLEASEHTDINALVIDKENGTVTITDPEMKLDVGAIAKGYAVEMVAQKLEKKGFSGYMLNVGGNVRTIGAKADGTPWTVGVENPLESEEKPYVAYLKLAGESVVTSGLYQRYYVVDGKRYHHIIDPATLMPSEGFDYAFVDTWRDASDGAPMYEKMIALEHLSPSTEFDYWIEHFLISRRRALFIENVIRDYESGKLDTGYDDIVKKLDALGKRESF